MHPVQQEPLALRRPLRQELDGMESTSVIKKVDEPLGWVDPFVIACKKDEAFWAYMDPREINKNLKHEHYPMPTREEIEAELSGAKFFSQLDAKVGFHKISLDKVTSRVCTFVTPFGCYRFLRLPFGISSASKVFQKNLNRNI